MLWIIQGNVPLLDFEVGQPGLKRRDFPIGLERNQKKLTPIIMAMIWQLFGVHISLTLIIIFLLLAWLLWPRRFPRMRKRLLMGSGLVFLGSVLLALYTYWPTAYEKKYLAKTISPEIEAIPFKQLADSIDFHIGVAIGPDDSHHDLISKLFNSVVAENEMKPGRLLIDPKNWDFDFSKADALINFANTHNMRMRGHTLIWGKFPGMTLPIHWITEVKAAADKKSAMASIMKRYIETVMKHFKGRVPTWDVVNEPMGGDPLFPSIFTESMGEEYIDYAFNIAHEADPDCSLFLNEQIGDFDSPQAAEFLNLLQRLMDRGVPIDGVGLQTHHINKVQDIAGLKKYIRAIGEMGLKVEITELDVRLLLFDDADDPYQAQGDQFKYIVKACIDDPDCHGVTLWGLTDGANWMDGVPPFKWKSPNAPNIFDENMHKKPAYVGIWEALKEAQTD